MNKIINKISQAIHYYRMLIYLTSIIKKLTLFHKSLFIIVLILSACFEISLLGSLFILINIFMNISYYDNNYALQLFTEFFNIQNNNELILFLSFFFISITLLAGVLRLYYLKLISRYVYFFGKDITGMCYQRIIFQDYKNLLNNNINESLSIFQKMPIVINSFFMSHVMFYNFITFILIFGVLSFINFKITLIASISFITIYLAIILLLKKRIFNNGTIIAIEQSTNLKITRETYNGFRDILINNYQKFYNNIFLKSYSKLIAGNEDNRFFYSAPKPIIESFLLASIGVIIALNSNNYNNLEKFLPTIAVMAIASQRILPILNQLYSGHMANEDATPHTKFIINFLKKPITKQNKKKIKPLKFKDKISYKDVSFSYSSNKYPLVIKNINLDIFFGSRIGIIGKSGSGKSTFADLTLGLLNPTYGRIYVDGVNIKNQKQNWYANVASVPQNIFITEQTIAENIAFGVKKNKINTKIIKEAAKKAQLADFIEGRKENYGNVIGEKGVKISAGQRQRIAIARALYKKSKLIIFDEATSSLDEESEKNILNIIFGLNRKKYTSILISHKISNLKRCDHIYKIQNFKLIKVK